MIIINMIAAAKPQKLDCGRGDFGSWGWNLFALGVKSRSYFPS